MKSFWNEIDKPIFALAPMEDVTDTVFREVILSISNPQYIGVMMAEFTSTDGICHPVGKAKVTHRLYISSSERELLKQMNVKIIAQIWGSKPENFLKSAEIISNDYDFDGIDINMGCPVKKIVKQASCSQLIQFPELAKEIIYATMKGSKIPVSVKTRTGIKTHITEQWISTLLETKPAAITLHGRTQKMMSAYPAEWDEIKKAVDVRNALNPDTVMLGNGDVLTIEDGLNKITETGADGVMIGRGIFANPWIFNLKSTKMEAADKLAILWKHANLFGSTWGKEKKFPILKRFFKIYTSDFHGAAEMRAKFMETNSIDDVRRILDETGLQIKGYNY